MMPERIVDYFYTCGLEENMGLEPYESGLRSYRTRRPLPLERPFKCKILQHFPDYALNHTFDAESTSLVTMPSGVWLRTQRQMESVRYSYPKRHTFVITREDGSRVHGLALLFLSEVTHENVKEAVCSLQDLIVGTSHKDEQSIYVRNRDKLFATKAIGLISRYPFIHGLFGWLEDLWASMFLCLPCGPEAKLEPFIYKLLYETSLLEPGRFITFSGAFRSHFGYFPAVLTPIPMLLDGTTGLSAAVELPLFEYSLLELLRLIDLTDFIRLFTCVLLEHRIVLFSSAYYRLMLVAEGITCLLLPFVWSHVYAPILPMSLIHFVNAPVPYIMGIKQLDPEATTDLCPAPWDAYSSGANHFDCSSPIELTSEANVCYVYIDEGRVVVPDETPHFPNAEHVLYSMSNLLTGINFQSSANSSSLKPLTQYQSSETQAPVPRPRPPSDLSLSQWSSRKTQTSVPVRTVSTTTTGGNPTKFELGADSVTDYDTGDYNRCSYVKSCIRAAHAIVSADDFPSYTHLIHFNTAARTVFLRNFANIFRDYDKFFVPERGVFESTGEKRYVCSGLHAFDKFGFLSDQPETHLQFLSAFLETQMFAAFLDYRLTRSVDRGAPSPGCMMDRHPMMPLYMTIFDHAISQIRQTTLTVPRGVADDSSNSSTFLPNQTSAHNLPPTPRAQEVAVPLPDLLNVATTPPNNTTRDTSPFGAIGFPCFVESPHMPSIVSGMLSDECISRSLDAIVCNFPHLSKEMLTMPSASSYGCDYHRMPGSNLASILHLRSNERAHLPVSSAPNSPRVNNLHQKLPIAFMSTPTKRAAPDSPTVLSRHSPSPVARSFAQSHQFAALQRSGMAQTNWDFVDALLDECKHRTKRMVLKKMGHEAVELGHTDPTVSVIEENTLVSGLCDLLDRIWSHGLNKKSGKSALWSHLVEYVRIHTTDAELDSTANLPEHTTLESNTPWFTTAPGTSSNLTTLCQQRTPLPNETIGCTPRRMAPHGGVTIGSRQFSIRSPLFTRQSASLGGSNMPRSGMFDLPALFGPQISQHSLVRDVLTIRNLRDIKTDVSFARAFVRLALEKKLLSAYLSELLMDVKLLRNLYCRYAFLRCEEEREQFLIHLLSLNAVDYFSFTRMLTQAELLYKVFICTGRKHGFASTSNLSIRLHGHLGSTGTIVLPRGEATAEFRHVNLGILSIVQVGHDNSGPTPKWFIEFVLVYNVFVNHLYVFPCGHWLGRGIEDDALERILIGELVRGQAVDLNPHVPPLIGLRLSFQRDLSLHRLARRAVHWIHET
ncbi:unnamed protein product [Dicrocoelium dendriticum]|nr:unnamed protein product [Dicrocoelium dendriticum]